MIRTTIILLICLILMGLCIAGPYSESGISGYIHPLMPEKMVGPQDAGVIINPIFRGWADGWIKYSPTFESMDYGDPAAALGPAVGCVHNVVSLGDLSSEEIAAGEQPGYIVMSFGDPANADDSRRIRNGKGYDFVVFGNGWISNYTTGGGSVSDQIFAELAHVEVSSDGSTFVRFPSVSLTPDLVGPYGTIEMTNVYNLAGKHPNGYGLCTATAFDLSELKNTPEVQSGQVDLERIGFIRIVDIPGNGSFYDNASAMIDPLSWPHWENYFTDGPIFDAWLTWGDPAGFDLEAIGVLHEQQYSADINLDGIVNMLDFAIFANSWKSSFGEQNYLERCNLVDENEQPTNANDLVIDEHDLMEFQRQWLQVESWSVFAEKENE